MDEGTLNDCITKVNDYDVNCDMRAFLQFQGSQAGLFSDLSAGEAYPLRIAPQAGPAASPTDKPRKDGALSPVTSEKHSYLIKIPDGGAFMITSSRSDSTTFAVIMAGGSGTRFWPRSRKNRPKQLLNITGDEILLKKTIKLIAPIIPASRITIVTTSLQADSVKNTVPQIPEDNVIIEPFGKNTAPAIGIAALFIEKKDTKDAVMVVLPADHYIEDTKTFQQTIMAGAAQASQGDCIVTIGIPPRGPETGYGYIEAGEKTDATNGIYAVTSFHEKPDIHTAERFIKQGTFFWNSGIFIARTSTMLKEIEEYLPHNYQGLMKIKTSLGADKESDVISSVYNEMEAISIDYGVIEKSKHVFMIQGNFGWNDVGSWPSAAQYWPKDSNKHSFIGDVIGLDSSECIVYSPKKPVALLGVKDLVIVEDEDALLVCKKERAQDVKKLVEMLKSKGRDEIL